MCKECFSGACTGWKVKEKRYYCDKCNRTFGNHQCFLAHIQIPEKGKSICEEVIACQKCGKVVFSRKKAPGKHHCGEKKCSTCGYYIPLEGKEHPCFLKKLKKHPLSDFEKDDVEVDPLHENDKGNERHSDSDINNDDEKSSDKEPMKTTVYYFDPEAENSAEHTCNCVCVINQEGSEKKYFMVNRL